MDPISMDTATSPTNPDPRSPRPPPSATSAPRQRATHRGIRARRATTTGVVARAYQLPCGQAHEARRRRGDGALASSWPTGASRGGDPARASAGTVQCTVRSAAGRPAVDGPGERRRRRVRTTGARSRTRIRRWGVPGAAVRVAVGVRPPRSSVGAGSVASSCCRGSQCQPQPSGLTIFIFFICFEI